jgi:hypothetical protein
MRDAIIDKTVMSARKAHPDSGDWRRIDIEIAGLKSRLSLYCILLQDDGNRESDIRAIISRIDELEARLTPTRASDDALAS